MFLCCKYNCHSSSADNTRIQTTHTKKANGIADTFSSIIRTKRPSQHTFAPPSPPYASFCSTTLGPARPAESSSIARDTHTFAASRDKPAQKPKHPATIRAPPSDNDTTHKPPSLCGPSDTRHNVARQPVLPPPVCAMCVFVCVDVVIGSASSHANVTVSIAIYITAAKVNVLRRAPSSRRRPPDLHTRTTRLTHTYYI